MRAFWVAAVIVAIDQVTKTAVVRSMHLGQSIPLIGDWLKLTYTENPGMAFGITVGPEGLITVFAFIATILIGVYLYRLRGHYAPYRYSLSLILGGALGNIIDRLLYGVIYGYDALFQGRVVDFIHVDIWRGFAQDLFPFLGGDPWVIAFFPIWNVADMAIVIGVVGILLFQRRFHEEMEAEHQAQLAEQNDEAQVSSLANNEEAVPTTTVPPVQEENTPQDEAGNEGVEGSNPSPASKA